MELREMENEIKKNREDFARVLRSSDQTIKPVVSKYFENCCSEFEEQTMIENLKEVFEAYLEEVKAA